MTTAAPAHPLHANSHSRLGHGGRQGGFTLVELSVVLVAIFVVLAAVMSGANVYRSAQSQRTYTEFVLGWRESYITYVTASHNVQPGDDPSNPQYAVAGAVDKPLCGDDLLNAMLKLGVTLPTGRAPEMPDRYVYSDKSGTPHEIKVCLETVNWAIPDSTVGSYKTTTRHILLLSGVTPELATTFDAMSDGNVDARFGDFREDKFAADTGSASQAWSADASQTMGNVPEGEAVELVAYLSVGK